MNNHYLNASTTYSSNTPFNNNINLFNASPYYSSYSPYSSHPNMNNQPLIDHNTNANYLIREQLAKQQACIHRAVKDIIEGKGNTIFLIINTLLSTEDTQINNNLNKQSAKRLNMPCVSNKQKVYLNIQHPFYNLIQAYNTFDRLAFNSYFPDKEPSPYTQLLLMCDSFISIREQLELQQESNGLLSVNLLALQDIYWLINTLKINSDSPEFKKALSQYNHDTGYTDNFRAYSQYIKNLFHQYSRLLIIRIDLGYQQQQLTSYETFRTDMDYLLKLIPSNPVFKDLIGYIWKLEYGTDKGYHAHLLLCYDSAKRRSDYHIAKQIGELWQNDITLGRGLYYNCNTKEQKANYRHCYLGMVHRSETDKINWIIEYGISYLLKIDEYLRLMKPDNRRILGRGILSKRKV